MFPDPKDLSIAAVSEAKQRLLGEAILEQCDAIDGLADGTINNPLLCEFDPVFLTCVEESDPDCLNARELAAVNAVYSDVSVDGRRVAHGLPKGAELTPGGWSRWLSAGIGRTHTASFQGSVAEASTHAAPGVPNAGFGCSTAIMKYLVLHDPDWD